MHRRMQSYRLFPYTTLFRSKFEIAITFEPVSELLEIGGCNPLGIGLPQNFAYCDHLVLVLKFCGNPMPSGLHPRSEEHTSELQSQSNLVCRILHEKKNKRAG